MPRFVLLSFDVEEFDIPLEFNFPISETEQMDVGKRGLDAVLPVIASRDIKCTMFTTANYALYDPSTIKEIAKDHEIASHTYFHSSFEAGDLLKSRKELERISGRAVTGLRMPFMRKIEPSDIVNAGYTYDSSTNPTIVPGRYNNLHLPRTLYNEKNLWHIPTSVSPILRLPLFWLAFKNYPYQFYKKICLKCIEKDGYIVLYFHPWEFVNIKKYNLPHYVSRYGDKILLQRFSRLVDELQKDCEFIGMQDFIDKQ